MICDTHMHFYDDAYPLASSTVLRPPNASADAYRGVQQRLGLERVVVVQPTTYGLDNSCQLDAVAELGEGARAVVVVDGDVTDADLRTLTDGGAVGARFHMLPGGAVSWEALAPVAAKVAAFGWHIQLQLDGHELPRHLDQLLNLPCPLVIDHVGRFMPPVDPSQRAFMALQQLVDNGAYVKLSAPYESAADPSHEYETVSTCVAALLKRAPDQMLWATNWPHPGQSAPPTLDDLARLRSQWLHDELVRDQVLVTNPARLYGF